jgi:exopolysaccharide biosynthesis protein
MRLGQRWSESAHATVRTGWTEARKAARRPAGTARDRICGTARLRLFLLAALWYAGVATADEWTAIAPGVEYRHVQRDSMDAHAVRADLREKSIAVVASAAREQGLTVSEFARSRGAIAAVNGDYFDSAFAPVGLAMGAGEVWAKADERLRREDVIGVGKRRVEIFPRAAPLRRPKRWMSGAVSGWPMVVRDCAPISPLPGSDYFTRAPHPRTAVGLSKDRRRLLLVVADGRRDDVPGLTLPELAGLMTELGACTAVNLDGGGSSALWVGGRIVNRPSDGFERPVANHIAVVPAGRLLR